MLGKIRPSSRSCNSASKARMEPMRACIVVEEEE